MRAFLVIMTVFYTQNPPMLHSESSEKRGMMKRETIVAGHPAEILDDQSIDVGVIENVGHPDEVFIHSADIARYLDCSLEAGRRMLKKLERADLLQEHGDIGVEISDEEYRSVNLYRPAFDDPKKVMRTLYEMSGERPPNFVVATEEVTPGQFEHLEGSRFQFVENNDVVIDVSEPEESDRSIQNHISDQLAEHGLAASSLKNFAYELRQQGGLIE